MRSITARRVIFRGKPVKHLLASFVALLMAGSVAHAQEQENIWVSPEGAFHVLMPHGWQAHPAPANAEGVALLLAGPPTAPYSNDQFQACHVFRMDRPVAAPETQQHLNGDMLSYAQNHLQRHPNARISSETIDGMLLFRADETVPVEGGGMQRMTLMFQFPRDTVSIIYSIECAIGPDVEASAAAAGVQAFIDSIHFNGPISQ